MSNLIRLAVGETRGRLDADAARRQFALSLRVGLGVMAVAAMIALQPTRTVPSAPSIRPSVVSLPEFVVWPVVGRRPRRSAAVEAG